MLIQTQRARDLESLLWYKYMGPKDRGVSKNLILGADFLKN